MVRRDITIIISTQNTLSIMTQSIGRDQARRNSYARHESKRLILKSMISDLHLSKRTRAHCVQMLNLLPRASSVVRLRRRCLQTGRGRGTLRVFQISRICLRELAHQGLLPGVTKASW